VVARLVLSYYVVLRSVLRLKPWLRKCLARCRHCGIFFLTDARNAGRKNLGCPFGCRQAHRQSQSTRRSVDYYRHPNGKTKKRDLNARRRKTPVPPPPPLPEPPPPPPPEPSRLLLPWPRPILDYVRVVVGLIEGRPVLLSEIVEMLERTLRQHRMVRTRRIDQSVAWLNESPP
jgi:hypothetical protein